MKLFANAASFGSGLAESAKNNVIAARKATYGNAADACYDTVGRTCSDIQGHIVEARSATYGDAADACYASIGQTCSYMHTNVSDAAVATATKATDLPGNAVGTAGQVATMAIAARRATYGDAADACYEKTHNAVRHAADALVRFVGGADEAPRLASESGPSEVFIAEVEKPELGELCSAKKVVKSQTGITLPDDNQEERNIQLIIAYTRETPLYKEMNLGLRSNDQKALRKYAGYIRELRDAFAVDLPDAVVTPFSGTVRRGINVPNAADVLKSYVVDQEYVWPSFTSTSTSTGFSGNVQFEIACPKPPADHKGYAPANIKQFSAFPSEDEILFPPHMRLRVVNIKGNKVMMETTAFPSIWEMVEHGDWDGVEKWVEMNPDRVNVEGVHKSLVDTIAEASLLRDIPESIQQMMGITVGALIAARRATYGDAADACYDSLIAARRATYGDAADACYDSIGSMLKGGC